MLGTVTRLRRYPVKSMLGEDVPYSAVDAAGLTHDRRLALIHTGTGKVASAKNPRAWRALPTLSAQVGDGSVRITFPDGTSILAGDPGVDKALSAFLGQPVTVTSTPPEDATLDRAVPEEVLRAGVTAEVPVQIITMADLSPAGTFFDFVPLHVLTSSTLAEIAAHSPSGTVDAERYRPNIVIDTLSPGFTENDWSGRDIGIGADLVIRVVCRTPRCAIPTLQHGPLPRDPDALRVLAKHNRVAPIGDSGPEPCAGVYATVVHPGRISTGDPVCFI
jgi:MOSC domain-containing protein